MANDDAQAAANKKAAEALAEKKRIAKEKQDFEDELELRKETIFGKNNNWKWLRYYLAISTLLLIVILIQLTPDVCTSCEEKLEAAKITPTSVPTAEVTASATAESTSDISAAGAIGASPDITQTPIPSPTPDPDADFRPHNYNITLFSVQLSKESRFALLALIIGALGGLVHSLRSLSDYVGTRGFKNQWTLSYVLRPFISGGLALIAYLLIRGGFFSDGLNAGDKYKLLALSGLIGLFSEQTITKFRDIAGAILSLPQEKADPLPSSNKDENASEDAGTSSSTTPG